MSNLVLNSPNINIQPNQLQTILSNNGLNEQSFKYHNFSLYQRAFIHESITNIDNSRSNQALEFLGDGVLELVTKFYLYKRFALDFDEGFMSDTKIKLVNNKNIGKFAKKIGLNKFFILSPESLHLRNNDQELGCLFEAFIGAIFLDFSHLTINDEHLWFQQHFISGPGFQVAQLFIEHLFTNLVDWPLLIMHSDNWNRPLQELLQSEFKTVPHIIELSPHLKISGYHIGIYIFINYTNQQFSTLPCYVPEHSQQLSFDLIHKHLALHHYFKFKLGEAKNQKKANAKQDACQQSFIYLKEHFTDFDQAFSKMNAKN